MMGMPRMNIGEMLGSMMGHLVYGAAMGTVYGQSDRVSVGQALHADAERNLHHLNEENPITRRCRVPDSTGIHRAR